MIERNTECICTFAQKTVGDGCDFCNPDKDLDYAYDTITDLEEEVKELEAERDALKELNGELVEVVKPALEQIREYASSIMYHTEDDHIAHYVDQINNWCEAALIRAKQRVR